jgi:ferredoxin
LLEIIITKEEPMKGAIIYFSGTGNTEFAARQFKMEFEKYNNECLLIDIRKKKKINDDYDFFVFGGPIYYEMFPEFFMYWVNRNINEGKGRGCIVFSTQGDDRAPGVQELTNMLVLRNFEVIIQDALKMPNNYYIEVGTRRTDEEAARQKENLKSRVAELVELFIKNEKSIMNVSEEELEAGKMESEAFKIKSGEWVKNNLSINYDLCVLCGKCAKNCPVRNISMGDKIDFSTKCISCQRCIHGCPVNAFLHRGNRIELYKV